MPSPHDNWNCRLMVLFSELPYFESDLHNLSTRLHPTTQAHASMTAALMRNTLREPICSKVDALIRLPDVRTIIADCYQKADQH
ncbi:unnamed protein product [Amoebophrya sp. A25]|nr:unnamed protein product [Amoebophrya sp. A25]|eukprot:GSA25T00001101001.1